MIDTIICGDCLEVMPTIEDNSVNLVILDLPYNIKKAEWDSIPDYIPFIRDVFKECGRVLKDNGSLYWFCNDFDTMLDVCMMLRYTKFVFRQQIIWNKRYKSRDKQYTSWMQGFVSEGALRNYPKLAEYIIYFTLQEDVGVPGNDKDFIPLREYMWGEQEKAGLKTCQQINHLLGVDATGGGMANHYFSKKVGHKQWMLPTKEMYQKLQATGAFQRDYDDILQEYNELKFVFNNQKTHHSVWNYPVAAKIGGHVTPKPVALIENIIDYSSNEGDTVLDPTAGSGTTAVACRKSGRHYICIEKEPEYCAIAEKRLKEML